MRICSISAKGRHKCRREREPKGAESHKYDSGKGISEEELKQAADQHQDGSAAVVDAYLGRAVAPCSAPSHQVAGERRQREDEASDANGGRVSEFLTEVTW